MTRIPNPYRIGRADGWLLALEQVEKQIEDPQLALRIRAMRSDIPDVPPGDRPASRWTVVASGPSGHEVPRESLLGRTVIVVNSSINRVDWGLIDYYLFRHPSVNDHKDLQPLLDRGIGLVSVPDWRESPDWRPAVEFIECRGEFIKERGAKEIEWERGTYSPYTDPFGPQALQYAVNNGATDIDCWGMEGGPFACVELVPATGECRHVDDRLISNRHLTDYHRKIVQGVIRACPDVQFRFYGKLMYALDGENVEVVECHSPAPV